MSDSPKPPRISSPLNPSRSPHNSLPPGESPPALPVPPAGRPRGHSLSSMLGAKQARSRSSSPRTPRPPGSPSQSHSHSASASRSRSRSPTHDRLIASALLEAQSSPQPLSPPTPPNAPPSTWWGRSLRRERPWRDPSPSPSPHASPRLGAKKLLVKPRAQEVGVEDEWGEDEVVMLKRRSTLTSIPKEQTEGWERTRERVAQALKELLPTSALIAHDLLAVGAEALRFAPIPGLDVAASLLLNIWDSVQAVDINRLACLRLAERCANILLSVREEVRSMGDSLAIELEEPLGKLAETYTQIHLFLLKQAHRPFLKRYLKREEVLREIAGCDRGLGDALGMFSISIQLRLLRQARDAETQREGDRRVLEALARAGGVGVPGVGNALGLAIGAPGSDNALGLAIEPAPEQQRTPRPEVHDLPPYSEEQEQEQEEVIPTLLSLHTAQNTLDTAHDAADLRALMREALAQSSDVEMLRVLQVRRDEMPEALKTLQRALERVGYVPQVPQTPVEVDSSESGSGSSDGRVVARDTLDREFIEGGIDALRRMSKGGGVLPSWTITRYEVDRDAKIGIGFFSSVYRGTWRNRTVAIKCLAPQTPRELFLREVSIWRTLKHPHVLELYGASGASGDGPWFFVCPYERFGSLSGFLRRAAQEGREKGVEGREGDLLRFMHEIAKGMEYLHHQGVLHGDLKASNVLVDDRIHCLVADFGQSEMKSEAYRISGTAPPHGGTLRWQAPELMLGSSVLTPEMDVYSFAICCIEILLMGRMPWPLMSDEAVRNFVLRDKTRPQIPPTRFSTPALQEVLRLCWHEDPASRPQFYKIVRELKQQRRDAERPLEGHDELMSPPISPHVPSWEELEDAGAGSHHSPDMRPVPLPKTQSPDMRPVPLPKTPPMDVPRAVPFPNKGASPEASSSDSYHTVSQSWPPFGPLESHEEDTVSSDSEAPEPVVYTSSVRSRASSVFTPSAKSSSTEDLAGLLDLSLSGYESPMPEDERIAAIRNERRYRLLLVHDFHPSLTLPLWNPLPISLGAVGFVDRLSGLFVTLLNCFYPDKAAEGAGEGMPSVYGYGRVTTGNQRQDKRTAAQRGLDAIAGLLTFRRSAVDSTGPITQHVSRRYSFPLRSGHKAAYMCTESTMYRYVENLDAPKKWFRANVDTIMARFGARHQLQKEDLRLVIGTLDAPDYALFVSHNHPNGQAHFNVYSAPKTGQPWGTFTTDTEPELATGGPSYNEPILGNPSSACRVSRIGGQWDTVLVARLRFKPDVLEPTSL